MTTSPNRSFLLSSEQAMPGLLAPGAAPTFLIKADLPDPGATRFVLADQKTMYGGKRLRLGDRVFVFASETQGGEGLCALGQVTALQATPRLPGLARQTPRLSLSIQRLASPRQRLGRAELKPFTDWQDGRPETELNFKFYRQATNKLGGISAAAAAFLWAHF